MFIHESDEPPAVLYNSGCEYGMRLVHIEIEHISSGFYSDLRLLTLKGTYLHMIMYD